MSEQPTNQAPPSPDPQGQGKARQKRRGWQRVRKALVWIIILPILLFLALQLPVVQDFLADQFTQRVSKTLDARVTVGKVRLSWLDELTIEDLFVEDKYGDTLLYGGRLEANFDFLSGLSVETIVISDTRFQIRRDLGDPETNLTTAINKLFPTDPNKESNPLNLQLDHLDLFNISFVQNDSVKGQRLDVDLTSGVIRFDELDLPNQEIRISDVELRAPRVIQTTIDPTPLSDAVQRMDSLVQARDSSTLRLLVGNIEVIDGAFTLNNYRKDPIEASDITAVDFARLGMENIDLELADVNFYNGEFLGSLRHLSLSEKSGFVLDRLSVQDLKVTPTELQLYDLELVTAESMLSDSLRFTFPSWGAWLTFNDDVRMDIKVKQSSVAVRDILYFARRLRFNPFFRDNRRSQISIAGNFSGQVNNLRGRNVNLALDRTTTLVGSFGSRNLSRPGSESLNLDLQRLTTNVRTIRRLIPTLKLPPNVDELGNLSLSGRFDGFFTDFVATGALRSEIGAANFNMALVLDDNLPARYSGELALSEFNMGAWTGNSQFGNVTFAGGVSNGVGFDPSTASADLAATIANFTYRGYRYENATIDGRLEERFFDGNFDISDDNIDFNFQGEIDFRDSIPTFDFDAAIGELDLFALNLSKKPIAVSGNIDLNLIGTNFSQMEGRIEMDSFNVLLDTLSIPIDSLTAFSNFNLEGEKVIQVDSDILTGRIVGRFDIEEVSTSLTSYLVEYYPSWTRRLNIKPPTREPEPNRFSFEFDIADSKGLNRLIAPNLGPLIDFSLTGRYDGFEDELNVELIAPNASLGDIRLVDLVVKLSGVRDEGDLDFAVDSTFVNGRHLANRVTLLSLVDDQAIDFGITYGGDEANILLNRINLDGSLTLPDNQNFELRFEQSNIDIFQQVWTIKEGNYLVFGPKYIDTRNFSLRSGRRSIRLNNFGEDGLNLDLLNMDLALIDSLWKYDQLDFSGDIDINVSVADVFRQQGIRAELRSDTFRMNGDDYGHLRVDLLADNPKSQLRAYASLNRDTSQLIAEGIYNLADLAEDPARSPRLSAGLANASQVQGFLDMDVSIAGYPLELARYWVGGSVSNIVGVFDAQLGVKGPVKRLDVGGYIEARNGGMTINYLQTRYTFPRNRVSVNNTLFDLAGGKLYDRFGNVATLSGGVTHDRLKNLGLNATINTDRFLALELEPGDNPLFFGTVLGKGLIRFTGNFRQTDIYAAASVGAGSRLSIPVNYSSAAGPLDNVRFVNRSVYAEEEDRQSAIEPTGVSLNLDLAINEGAIGEIIFDEEVGDILRGQGNGNLSLNIPRDGALEMYGDYNITRGSYLFTFQRIVNKEFSVRNGGKVTWTGNPMEATLDIEADYENLRTPILPFIREYIIGPNEGLESNANRATEVDLTLQLKGLLTKPDINFDLSFPNLDPQLENYANNKRRQLLLDQNELNRQVFGLIVAGQFLPSDLSFGVSDAAINTLSEWFSNYFSLLINDLVKDTFGEEAFISSFDFDFAYNSYRNTSLNTVADGRSSAVGFSISRDFNNRLRFSNDLNVFSNNQLGAVAGGTFVGNDLAIEYVLNDARTLRLRFYERLEPDILSSRRLQVGTGLSWRREFDSLAEFFRGFRRDAEVVGGR
ncbi:translocation/assembly module TamB domain-containing protein [Neolewinella antarctica]|uniref:Translocation and assembly module TamB C-terminal domain-containing protein n=1 Tax=Neolewinella antarctica TaxID=442734 RepID=A0ABX0X9R6_9BACT|nr:translocation/assembly module TamB domain-containing protein [Neolewinella antarctica]NJC25517.1 hypothetical protein [Neolewinella antarctica]